MVPFVGVLAHETSGTAVPEGKLTLVMVCCTTARPKKRGRTYRSRVPPGREIRPLSPSGITPSCTRQNSLPAAPAGPRLAEPRYRRCRTRVAATRPMPRTTTAVNTQYTRRFTHRWTWSATPSQNKQRVSAADHGKARTYAWQPQTSFSHGVAAWHHACTPAHN